MAREKKNVHKVVTASFIVGDLFDYVKVVKVRLDFKVNNFCTFFYNVLL